MIEAKAHWNDDKHALPLCNLLLNFVEEDVAIVANNHAEARDGPDRLVELMEDVADRLGPVPVTWLAPVGDTHPSNAMNAERTGLIRLYVVHEEAEQAIVLVQRLALIRVSQRVMIVESVAENVPLQSLEQEHLTGAQHAAPSSVTCVIREAQRLLQLAPVGEPCDGAEGLVQLIGHLV